MKLRYSEFVPYAPIEPGVVRINHVSPHCSGESKSMKIERTSDGRISAKCFRCGAWGIDSSDCGTPDSIRNALAATVETGTVVEDKSRKLGELVSDSGLWPLIAHHWVRQYGITIQEIKTYGIKYAKDWKRVYLPVWWKGEQVGYQLRKIYDSDVGPKYDSRVKGGLGFMSFSPVTSNEIVIVEDILSAIKVGRVTQSMALLSTGMSQAIKECLSHYDKFYIWLDMDNPQVIRQAVSLLKSLALFGETKLIQTVSDPKTHSTEEIKRLLYAT